MVLGELLEQMIGGLFAVNGRRILDASLHLRGLELETPPAQSVNMRAHSSAEIGARLVSG